MNKKFDFEDIIEIKDGIRKKYKRVAASPEGNFQYPTGRAGLRKQNYDDVILRQFPEEVLASYCGVGNPFSLASIPKGASILDIGCGAGVDSFVAAAIVGPEGRVIGIDLIPEMVERAKKNLQKTSLPNVTIQEGSAEDLPFPDEAFDDVTSNGVFNLIPDKMKALKEVLRVLKPEGRFLLADQILIGEIPKDNQTIIENWAR